MTTDPWDKINLVRARILARQDECDELYRRLISDLGPEKNSDWLWEYCFNRFDADIEELHIENIKKALK